MEIIRQVIVFDASDMDTESAFWAGMFGGRVLPDGDWHNVIDADDRWVMGIQYAPNHVPPGWPDGPPQQVHIDFHVTDAAASHERGLALGARLLKESDPTAEEGYRVYADPAGHPFCIGWGQPDEEAVRRYVRSQS